MLYEIAQEFPHEMIFQEGGPCISIYQPTHRHAPDNKQDPVVFKKLLQSVEEDLIQLDDVQQTEGYMEPFWRLLDDRSFWNKTQDGLAILSNAQRCIIYHLGSPVMAEATVSDYFDIRPLIANFQASDSFYLLGLTAKTFALYEGNQNGVQEIELPDTIPRTIEEALGEEYGETFLNQRTSGRAEGSARFYSHGGKKEEADQELERFFRVVDREVYDFLKQNQKKPLILVSLTEHHSIFRKISNNPNLLETGVKSSYEALNLKELWEHAWKIIAGNHEKRTTLLLEEFKKAQASFLGSTDIIQIGRAVFEKRIKTMFVEENMGIGGHLNLSTGEVMLTGRDNKLVGNLIDQLIYLTLLEGGEVVVLPSFKMPGESGVAAIYRF